MISINLLPHRELKRKENQQAFYALMIFSAVVGAVIAFAVYIFMNMKISDQDMRNTYLAAENKRLDKDIEDIAALKVEIEGLIARQQAVEDLQSDRNQPVYLLDELFTWVPEGVYLRSFKQDGQKVSLSGVAQSNERVSTLLHHLTFDSTWLEHPDLIEIRAATTGQGKEQKRVFEFTMNVGIKRPRDKDSAASAQKSAGPGGGPVAQTDKGAQPGSSAPTANPGAVAGATADKSAAAGDKASAGKAASSDAGGHGAVVGAPKKP